MPVHPDLLAAAARRQSAIGARTRRLLGPWAERPSRRQSGAGPVDDGRRPAACSSARPAGVLAADLAACNAYDGARAAAARVACPTLLLLGGLDRMTPPAKAKPLADAIEARAHRHPARRRPHAHERAARRGDRCAARDDLMQGGRRKSTCAAATSFTRTGLRPPAGGQQGRSECRKKKPAEAYRDDCCRSPPARSGGRSSVAHRRRQSLENIRQPRRGSRARKSIELHVEGEIALRHGADPRFQFGIALRARDLTIRVCDIRPVEQRDQRLERIVEALGDPDDRIVRAQILDRRGQRRGGAGRGAIADAGDLSRLQIVDKAPLPRSGNRTRRILRPSATIEAEAHIRQQARDGVAQQCDVKARPRQSMMDPERKMTGQVVAVGQLLVRQVSRDRNCWLRAWRGGTPSCGKVRRRTRLRATWRPACMM